MKALLLAAGRGSRLGKHTADQPKCLTRIGERSLIERQIETLRGAGIDEIVVATGYRAEMLEFEGIQYVHNPDWATTNMVETLFCAEEHLTNDVIVAYADIIYEPCVLRALIESPHDVSVVVDRQWRKYWEHRFDEPLSDAESMRISENGQILELGQAVTDIEKIQAQYIGLTRFRHGGLESLRAARHALGEIPRDWMQLRLVRQAYMTDLLMELILRDCEVYAVFIDGGWLEIDTENDLSGAAAMWADGSIKIFFDPSAT